MPTLEEERFQDALRRRLERSVRYHGARPEYAIVEQLSPIRARRESGDELLVEDDDLLFGHAMKLYAALMGVQADDTLVIALMKDGNYAVIDVLHDREVGGGAGGTMNQLRSGDGAPAPGLGIDGDFYIDEGSDELYGPKAAGDWGTPLSLVGPAGPAGPSGASFVHTQAVPAAVWNVVHGLGKHPSVTIEDSAHSVVDADVAYVDNDVLTISFIGPMAGWAYLV